jgi:hypothetical protein
MDGKSLERWQAERLRDAIRPKLAYVRRLRRRMERRGFPGTDKLYQLVRRAKRRLTVRGGAAKRLHRMM